MDGHHFMQALPWACPAAAWARGRGDGQRGRGLDSTGQRRAPRRGLAAGSRLASGWQMGFGAAEEAESPRAGREASGTRALVSLVAVMM